MAGLKRTIRKRVSDYATVESDYIQYALDQFIRVGWCDDKFKFDVDKKEILSLDGISLQEKVCISILKILSVISNLDPDEESLVYTMDILTRLIAFKPLSALTGEDDEWIELNDGELWQNIQSTTVFKKADGKAYDLEGRVFINKDNKSVYVNEHSKTYIEFPYEIPDEPECVDEEEYKLAHPEEYVEVPKPIPNKKSKKSRLENLVKGFKKETKTQAIIETERNDS